MVLLPLSMTTSISAQEEESEDSAVEEVVTTGIRSSLIDAISIKRDNVGVVDAITAEDIGKFAIEILLKHYQDWLVLQLTEIMVKVLL